MRLFETITQAPIAGAIGWTLIESLWQGVLVSAAIAAVLLLTRRARLRYAAACMAMLTILGAFVVTLVHLWPEAQQSTQMPQAAVVHALYGRITNDDPASWQQRLAPIAPWLALFWMAGVFAFYLRHLAGLFFVRRLRARGVCAAAENWQRTVRQLSARLKLSRPVLLLESCFADSPMVVGHLRPLILMPIGVLTGLPVAHVEAILLHELAHVRRHDYLVNTLQRLIEGLLFYHPAVWWISHVIRSERENCCDDTVVAINSNAQEYAFALTALEAKRRPACGVAMAVNGGSLTKRIRRMLYPQTLSGASPFLGAGVLVIMTAVIALGAWQKDVSVPSAAQAQSPHADKYSKWLNEDVIYIIQDSERAAFEKLTSDEERDQFIDQFWRRRDAPGAPAYSFKKEHYRRIAFANKHFGTASGIPGRRTDRGHVYIVYGPPDEIDSNPEGTPSHRQPFEMWTYRRSTAMSANGSFTFVDGGSGDYRLAPTGTR